MKKICQLFILFYACTQVFSQSGIYNINQIKIKKTYKELSPIGKYRYDSLSYEKARKQKEYVFETFNYKSDGFEVSGYLCRPKKAITKKVPVIIYNRGGTGNFGKLSEEDLPDFYWLAKNGFAVYASNYRFVGEMGKMDQSGGDDINDVLNLYNIVKKIDDVDGNNVFMMGVSRGGMMTYQSLKKINVNAAAVIGGIADFKLHTIQRPIFIGGWSDLEEEYNYKGLANILPEFNKNSEKYLNERSAIEWADEINTPIYILHSRQDGRVSVTGAIELVQQLDSYNKEYKFKIYNRKSHSLPYSKFDSFEEITTWFKSHLK
ncbi:prolyl oligopeptidase family serine peptidase [Maribacter sp. MMG018]|uniref:alpha/beta hydrolase family protein n=1 Tax=Maribacter sp. MMG018 TaxID=2822688 RepID=UPI001B365B59|nr:prolyl oligopeptidase family serine peptidase [Maribacter sp. MMG018]MBQ4915608.1 prolyl oligopeptidase family serine peptidase [Maribacter sp. MMG018]